MRSLLSFAIGVLLLLIMIATTLPALSIHGARNLTLAYLLGGIPSPQLLESMRAGWFGVGLPAADAEERRTILTQYAEHAEQPVCTTLVRNALRSFDALGGQEALYPTQLDILLSARAMECQGQITEALQIIQSAPDAGVLKGAQIGMLLSDAQRSVAEHILRETVCKPLASWCDGYVAALLDTWHGGAQRSAFFQSTYSPPLPVEGRLAPLSMTAIPGVSVARQHPLVIDDALPPDAGDNYIAFTNTPLSTPGGEVTMYVLGEVLDTDAASCLVLRLVYFDDDLNYLSETMEQVEVEGAFRLDHRERAPTAAAYVTPRITFNADCLSGATAIGIYTVDLEVEAHP